MHLSPSTVFAGFSIVPGSAGMGEDYVKTMGEGMGYVNARKEELRDCPFRLCLCIL